MISIITIFHNERYRELAFELSSVINAIEPQIKMVIFDNCPAAVRGIAEAQNLAAKQVDPETDILGFLNPDVKILGRFADQVEAAFEYPDVVIAGNRYGKGQVSLDLWQLRNWVCGACFFVRKSWFDSHGGYDEQFVWGYDETDLIKCAEEDGKRVVELGLPIIHVQMDKIDPVEQSWKNNWMAVSWQNYRNKHNIK